MQMKGIYCNLSRVSSPRTCDSELPVENREYRKRSSTLTSSQPSATVGGEQTKGKTTAKQLNANHLGKWHSNGRNTHALGDHLLAHQHLPVNSDYWYSRINPDLRTNWGVQSVFHTERFVIYWRISYIIPSNILNKIICCTLGKN